MTLIISDVDDAIEDIATFEKWRFCCLPSQLILYINAIVVALVMIVSIVLNVGTLIVHLRSIYIYQYIIGLVHNFNKRKYYADTTNSMCFYDHM